VLVTLVLHFLNANNGSDPDATLVNSRMVIDGSGNVGIGTTSPGAKLHLYDGATTGQPELRIDGYGANNGIITFRGAGHANAAVGIRHINTNDSTGDLAFYANSVSSATLSERMRITGGGNVGIGTTSPNYNLEVAGTGYYSGDLKLGSGTFTNTSGSADLYVTGNLEVDGSTWLGDAAADTLTVIGTLSATNASMTLKKLTVTEDTYLATSSGNVGIGTTGPVYHLQVEGAGDAGTSIALRRTDGGQIPMGHLYALGTAGSSITYGTDLKSYNGGFEFWTDSTPTDTTNNLTTTLKLSSTGGLSLGSTYVGTDPGAGNMIIQGNVGIGTTGPSSELSFGAGDKAITIATTDASDTGSLSLSGGGTASNARGGFITFSGNERGGTGGDIVLTAGNVVGADIIFNAGGSDRMTILNGGNVGIGTANVFSKLRIMPSARTYLGGITISDSGNNDHWGIKNGAGLLTLGFVNNVATPVEGDYSDLVTFKSGGNVGIGTTNPTHKLEVAGNVRCQISYTYGTDLAEMVPVIINKNLLNQVPMVNTALRLRLPNSSGIGRESDLEGVVVSLDSDNPGHMKITTKAYDTAIAGCISTNPGSVLGSGEVDGRKIALVGKVPVWVDASYGDINIGDLLVSSPTPGCAMAADLDKVRPGVVLGKAMEAASKLEGRCKIKVWVNLQ